MTAPRISTRQAQQLLERGHAYLDVRSEEEFALGHPAGAYNVPLMLRQGDGTVENHLFLSVVRACFSPDQGLVIGCERGERSRVAAAALLDAGYCQIHELRSGFGGLRDPFGRTLEPGWSADGLPCATEPEPGRDYDALLARAK